MALMIKEKSRTGFGAGFSWIYTFVFDSIQGIRCIPSRFLFWRERKSNKRSMQIREVSSYWKLNNLNRLQTYWKILKNQIRRCVFFEVLIPDFFSGGGFGFWLVSCEKEQPAKRKKRKQIFATAWLMSCWRGLNLLRPSLMYQFVAPLHDEWVTSLSGRFCALILSLATKQRYVIYFLSQNKNQ